MWRWSWLLRLHRSGQYGQAYFGSWPHSSRTWRRMFFANEYALPHLGHSNRGSVFVRGRMCEGMRRSFFGTTIATGTSWPCSEPSYVGSIAATVSSSCVLLRSGSSSSAETRYSIVSPISIGWDLISKTTLLLSIIVPLLGSTISSRYSILPWAKPAREKKKLIR